MSINVKKYTKDQMAKMVEEAVERLESQKTENAELAERLKSQTAKTIALRKDLMAKEYSVEELKADLDASKAASKLLNDQGQEYWRAWQASKREVADLKNKLNDTEAALGRANATVSELKAGNDQQTKELIEWQRSAQALHDDLLDARERANYAESHPWRNLWAWVKRKLARHGWADEHLS